MQLTVYLLSPLLIDALVWVEIILTQLEEHELLLYRSHVSASAQAAKISVGADLEAWQDPHLFTGYPRMSMNTHDTAATIQELTSPHGFNRGCRTDALRVHHWIRAVSLSISRPDSM